MHSEEVTAIQHQFLQRVAGGTAERVSLVEDSATKLARTFHPANRILIFVQNEEIETYGISDCGQNLFIDLPFS